MIVTSSEELIYQIKTNQLVEMGKKRMINEGLFFYAINNAGDMEQTYYWKDNNIDELPLIEEKFKNNNNIKTVFVSNEYRDWVVEYITK